MTVISIQTAHKSLNFDGVAFNPARDGAIPCLTSCAHGAVCGAPTRDGHGVPCPYAPAPWTLTRSSANFCLRSVWSWPPSASASWVMFIEQNLGPHMEQNFASL